MNTDSPTPPGEPTVDDLAAMALDALDAPEHVALQARLADDTRAAETERTLRRAAGEYGAAEPVAVAVPPPPGLRARVLAAAHRRRSPAPLGAATAPAMHRTELGRVLGLLAALGPEAWRLPVDPPEFAGWTVHDVVAHLVANESLLAEALGAEDGSPDDAGTNEARTAQARARLCGLDPRAAVDELAAAAEAVDRHVAALADADLDGPVDY